MKNVKLRPLKDILRELAIILPGAIILGLILALLAAETAKSDNAIQPDLLDDRSCLAANIYFEARNQPYAGQFAVGLVTLNRVSDPRFPDTVCDVVLQGPTVPSWKDPDSRYPVKHRCQFSWYCDGRPDIIRNTEAWNDAVAMADLLLHPMITFIDITEGAIFYHATYVTPGWAEHKKRTLQIDTHVFYSWE